MKAMIKMNKEVGMVKMQKNGKNMKMNTPINVKITMKTKTDLKMKVNMEL